MAVRFTAIFFLFAANLFAAPSVFAGDIPFARSCEKLPGFFAEFDHAGRPAAYLSWVDSLAVDCFDSVYLSERNYLTEVSGTFPELSPEAIGFIEAYLKFDTYSEVNRLLRTRPELAWQEYRCEIEGLVAALEPLPNFSGIVFRGSDFPPVAEEHLAVGTEFVEPAFLSTSREEEVGVSFAGTYLTMILSKGGKPVPYRDETYRNEKEVIFPIGRRFRIIGIVRGEDPVEGLTYVYLEDLGPQAKRADGTLVPAVLYSHPKW